MEISTSFTHYLLSSTDSPDNLQDKTTHIPTVEPVIMIQPKSFRCSGWRLTLPSLDFDELMPSDHFLAVEEAFLEEMQAAIGDLPFLDNVGQMTGAIFYWEGGEWHWLVKLQPLLHNEFQLLGQDRHNEGDGGHDQVSIDSSIQEVSPEQGQTPTQVRSSSLKRSAAERDDDLSNDQLSSRKRQRAGDVGDQKRLRESSTTIVPSYQQQIQQPSEKHRSMANQRPQKSSQAALPNHQRRIQTLDHKYQSSATDSAPRRVSRKENAVNQKKWKGKNPAWEEEDGDKLHELLKNQRADERASKKKPLRDVKLWSLMSARLEKYYNIERSSASCKAYWSRYGRRRSQFDERVKPNPDMLATSLQGPKNGKKMVARKPKREGEETASRAGGYHDGEDDDYKTQPEDFPQVAPESK